MNIPNAISLFRIALVPVFVAAYSAGDMYWTLAVLLLCGASDILDGALARRFNMVTELGKILDPVADKLIQAAMMLCAAGKLPQMWLLLSLHVLRELSLAALGLYVRQSTGQVHSAKWYGKLCTAFIYVLMLSLIIFPELPIPVSVFGMAVCGMLMVFCMVMYTLDFIRILRQAEKKREEKSTDRA